MALVQCGECGNKVSDKAVSCPQCGNPIAARSDVHATGAPLMTTQVTAKKFKLQKLIAIGMVLGSLMGACIASTLGETVGGILLMLTSPLLLGGLIFYMVTVARSWWHHG